jgi:transketolase
MQGETWRMCDLLEQMEEYRKRIIKTAWMGKGGHITSALSAADIMAVLYWGGILRHDSQRPDCQERDRFILSKAHAGVGFYTLLAMDGYFPMDDLKQYCHAGQHMGDHSNMMVTGVENSGGSLGHGLGYAAGIALSAKLRKEDYLTYVLTGDGECQEGSIWESAMFIGNRELNNMVWIIDYNRLQANGRTDNTESLDPLDAKLRDFGFEVRVTDGHDHSSLKEALYIDRCKLPEKPVAVIANTIKGYGVPLFENKEGWHGRTPNEAEYAEIIRQLGMTVEEFISL